MTTQLTPRQDQILTFVTDQQATGFTPSMREIGAAVGLAAVSAVRAQLQNLEEAGYIRLAAGKARAIQVLRPTKTAKTYSDAWDAQETFEGHPHGWIQWKRTEVCIDIHCGCGVQSHYDGDFMYCIQCPHCERKYFTNGHIQLIEIDEYDGAEVKVGNNWFNFGKPSEER